MSDINFKAGYKALIKKGAYLARDMEWDDELTEMRVENWHRETMWLIQYAKDMQQRIEKLEFKLGECEGVVGYFEQEKAAHIAEVQAAIADAFVMKMSKVASVKAKAQERIDTLRKVLNLLEG